MEVTEGCDQNHKGSGKSSTTVCAVTNRLPIAKPTMPHAVLLYDGLCGLCDRAVQFTLRYDRDDLFRFAPLQTALAAAILRRHGFDPAVLTTAVLVLDPELPTERLMIRSNAVLQLLSGLGPPWTVIAAVGRLCPHWIRDRIYDWVASVRYRVFGRYSSCPVPTPAQRLKFLAW
jgi:predicted DCC family thiol-disulfide oxidoreductase YuxK